MKSYFDEYGRCIPGNLKASAHEQSRRYFNIVQPEVNYSDIYSRLVQELGVGNAIDLDAFKSRAKSILTMLEKDEYCKNITQGVGVPFILPKEKYGDIGGVFEARYLPAVEKAFIKLFPQNDFTNHCKSSLKGKFKVRPDSRHDRLIAAMEKECVVGYYFPCLLEYSLPAALERVKTLPEQFLLAGCVDTAAALVGSPDLLLRKDGYPPLLWLSGLLGAEPEAGYHFEAYGYDLTFNRRAHLNQVAEYWASGLVVLG